MAGFPFAFTHITGIKRQHHKAPLGQFVGIDTGTLFFDAAIGRAYDQRHLRRCLVHVLRHVQVAGQHQAIPVGVTDMGPLYCRIQGTNIVTHSVSPFMYRARKPVRFFR